jgi:hypothetical protein
MKRLLAMAIILGGAVMASAQPSPAPAHQGAESTPAGKAAEKAAEIPARLRPKLLVAVSPNQNVAVGDPVTLQIEATLERGVQISVPEQSFAPFELHARRARTEEAEGKQRFVFELDLLALDPGTLTIPALTLRVVGDDGALAEVKTDPQQVEVKSLIANEPNAAPKEPSKPVVVMQDDYTLAWVGGGLLAIGAVALLTLLTQRWLAKRPKPLPPPPPAVPAWDLALQKLADLDAHKAALFAAERGEEFVDGVSDVLREYLGRRYGFEGLESTSDEVMGALERIRPHKLSLSGVSLLLEQCDLVKFARMKPDLAQCDDLWNGAVGLIRATTPPPEAAPEQKK